MAPVGVVLIAFAVANRHAVRLVLDPFAPGNPALAIEGPMFLFLIAALIFGLLVGGAATWLTQGRWRKAARRRSREAAELRRETERLNRQIQAKERPQLPQPAPAD